jgi:hypothetical protein
MPMRSSYERDPTSDALPALYSLSVLPTIEGFHQGAIATVYKEFSCDISISKPRETCIPTSIVFDNGCFS